MSHCNGCIIPPQVAQIHGGQPGLPYEKCACTAKRCKAYSVVIELEIQRVTCPGVWLCNNGKVTMQIFLLGLCTQTSAMNPTFPLLCQEKFIFRKNFANIQNLVDIDRKLDKEIIYMELIQWEDCTTGNVLATFKTTLNDLLYPFPCLKGVMAGVDVDLLMEATRIFPGIIAPKIEVSTKLTIEEVLCSLKQENQNDVLVINPKLISSKCVPKRCAPKHQKRVCHNKHYLSKCPPPNRCKKEEYRSFRNSYHQQHQQERPCSCAEDNRPPSLQQYNIKVSPICGQQVPPMSTKCTCAGKIACPLCAKYKNYFPDMPEDTTSKTQDQIKEEPATVTKPSKIPKAKPSSSWKEPTKTNQKSCSCRPSSDKAAKSGSAKSKDSKKELNLCACDGELKSVCTCKACKGCALCAEKNKSKSKTKIPEKSKTKLDKSKTKVDKSQGKSVANKSEEKETALCLPRASSTPLPGKGNSMCDTSNNQKFYQNLENFYKQLYVRAHNRLKNEMCKCEGESIDIPSSRLRKYSIRHILAVEELLVKTSQLLYISRGQNK